MPNAITITIFNGSLTYKPNKKVNRNSTVTFQLADERSSAKVTLDPQCFNLSSIDLSRDVPSVPVEIKSDVSIGTYYFSTPKVLILAAGQSKSKGKGEEAGPLVGDVDVVPDGMLEKGRRRRVASATAAEQGLTAR